VADDRGVTVRDWSLIPLRVVVAAIFVLHGGRKLFGGLGETAEGFAAMGFSPGIFWATLVALTEFLGGLSVFTGLFTRLGALGLSCVMAGAVVKVHLPNGFFLPGGYEYSLALLGASLTFFLGGAGQISLDGWRAARR
jgi:putative oxidoreductase